MQKTICILGAVKEEIAAIKRQMTRTGQSKLGKADVWTGTWQGKPLVLVRTGVGKVRARDALSRVLENHAPSLVISIGYAGGTHPSLKLGDLLVADKILEKSSNPASDVSLDAALADEAAKLPPPKKGAVFKGTLLTVDTVVCRPQDKKELGEKYGCLALDMETSVLARLAKERGIPFLSVRSITDAVDQELMDVSPFMEQDGEVSKLKAGWYVLTHPGSIKTFMNLKDIANQATRNMTEFLTLLWKQHHTLQ